MSAMNINRAKDHAPMPRPATPPPLPLFLWRHTPTWWTWQSKGPFVCGDECRWCQDHRASCQLRSVPQRSHDIATCPMDIPRCRCHCFVTWGIYMLAELPSPTAYFNFFPTQTPTPFSTHILTSSQSISRHAIVLQRHNVSEAWKVTPAHLPPYRRPRAGGEAPAPVGGGAHEGNRTGETQFQTDG